MDRRKGGVSSVVTAWCRIVKVVQLSRAGVLLPALSLYTISGINTTDYHYHLRRLGQYIPLTKTTWTSKVSGLPSRFAWWNVLSCSGDGGCCIEGHMRYIPAPSSAAVATPGHVARLLSTDGDQLGRRREIEMQKACKKCGQVSEIEEITPETTCPKCGAFYVKTDALIAEGAAIRSEQPMPRYRKASPAPVKHERKRYPLSRMVVKTYQLLIEVFLWIWIIFAAIFGYLLGAANYGVVAGIFGSLAGILTGFVLAALFSGIIFVLTDMRQSLEEIKNRIGE